MKKNHAKEYSAVPAGKKKERHGKGALLCIALVLLFLVILLILIRMDVGGFGNQVLRPILKDVPVLSQILPEPTDEQVAEESGYQSLAKAVERIQELEAQVDSLTKAHADLASEASTSEDTSEIAALQQQIDTLKVYEQNQKNFEATKEEFYKEVVYNDNVDVSDYTKWYESMDQDTAAKLYKEAVQTQEASEKEKELAQSYAKMKPKQAASILQNMTGDLDTVVNILEAMSAQERGEIMGEMDASFAAKITKKMTS